MKTNAATLCAALAHEAFDNFRVNQIQILITTGGLHR